jgi:hypothetical protein
MNDSIYLDPPAVDLSGLKPSEVLRARIGIMGTELATAERLICMGYQRANQLDLPKHAETLGKKIAQLEEQLKYSRN